MDKWNRSDLSDIVQCMETGVRVAENVWSCTAVSPFGSLCSILCIRFQAIRWHSLLQYQNGLHCEHRRVGLSVLPHSEHRYIRFPLKYPIRTVSPTTLVANPLDLDLLLLWFWRSSNINVNTVLLQLYNSTMYEIAPFVIIQSSSRVISSLQSVMCCTPDKY